jgi:iron complex transport system substrate-binding protein
MATSGLPHGPCGTSLSRRGFLLTLAAAGLATACSRGEVAEGPRAASRRQVLSDNGQVTVPTDPRRVVAVVGSFDVDMVAVGVMPVLTTTFAGPWVRLDESVKKTNNIPPKPEELVALEPDLMVGWNWVTKEPGFESLSAIAPYVGLGETAETAGPGFDGSEPLRSWDTLFLSVCDAVNQRARGVELVQEFEGRLNNLAERRSGQGEVSVARIEFYEQGRFTFRGQNEDTAALMKRIGLTVVGPDKTNNKASLETLPDIDADWLVISVGGGNLSRATYEAVTSTRVFKAISAVRAGRVHVVDGALWPGLGHLWARALTDDLERLFA